VRAEANAATSTSGGQAISWPAGNQRLPPFGPPGGRASRRLAGRPGAQGHLFVVLRGRQGGVHRVGAGRRPARGQRPQRNALGKAVADARHGADRRRAQQLAQRGHLHRQVVFLHHQAGPHPVQQLGLGEHAVALLHQHAQQFHRPAAQRHRHAVDQQLALVDAQFTAAEARGFRHPNPPAVPSW